MVKINKNFMPSAWTDELERLGSIGDLIGGIDTFAGLPTVNNAGFSGLVKTQIEAHDLLVVRDASADNHGKNALYEASTTATAGDALSWTFLVNFDLTFPAPKEWRTDITTDVPTAIATPQTVGDAAYAAYMENPLNVQVYVGPVREFDFAIDSSKKLTLSNYTADGWTAEDTVRVLYFA
jgi:hypothetical protein